MKARVDQDTCIGCGMCIDICPEVFKYNAEDKSESTDEEIPQQFESAADEAREVCPVEAIILE